MTAEEKETDKNISTTEYLLANFQRSDRVAVLVQAARHTDLIYHPQDFRLRTELIETDFRPHRQSPQLAPIQPRQLRQSEHAWAYAKRALARGDDSEELIRRIADFRAGEKPARLRPPHRHNGPSRVNCGSLEKSVKFSLDGRYTSHHGKARRASFKRRLATRYGSPTLSERQYS